MSMAAWVAGRRWTAGALAEVTNPADGSVVGRRPSRLASASAVCQQ